VASVNRRYAQRCACRRQQPVNEAQAVRCRQSERSNGAGNPVCVAGRRGSRTRQVRQNHNVQAAVCAAEAGIRGELNDQAEPGIPAGGAGRQAGGAEAEPTVGEIDSGNRQAQRAWQNRMVGGIPTAEERWQVGGGAAGGRQARTHPAGGRPRQAVCNRGGRWNAGTVNEVELR